MYIQYVCTHTTVLAAFSLTMYTYICLDCREFTAASTNPTGDAVVLGNYNALFIFTRNKDTMSWEDKGVTKVPVYVCMYVSVLKFGAYKE